jgi:hypothetical protein
MLARFVLLASSRPIASGSGSPPAPVCAPAERVDHLGPVCPTVLLAAPDAAGPLCASEGRRPASTGPELMNSSATFPEINELFADWRRDDQRGFEQLLMNCVVVRVS